MASNEPIHRSIALVSKLSAFEGICRDILYELENNGYSRDDIFAVHLAIEESFINAVKHGNNCDDSKKVSIDYTITEKKFEICIADQGVGFDQDSVPDPRRQENLYKTGGRGLLLIRSFMNKVEFNKQGNCICLARYKNGPNPAELKIS